MERAIVEADQKMPIEFRDDDNGYLDWIAAHPHGFVLNVRTSTDPSYVILHRASCASISSLKRAIGAYTARNYRKICADSVAELAAAAKDEGRNDEPFSRRCGMCRP